MTIKRQLEIPKGFNSAGFDASGEQPHGRLPHDQCSPFANVRDVGFGSNAAHFRLREACLLWDYLERKRRILRHILQRSNSPTDAPQSSQLTMHRQPPRLRLQLHRRNNRTFHNPTVRGGCIGGSKDRASAGITNGRVFRSADDANDVVILADVADVSKARTWLSSNEMKTTMEKSGVLGSPSIRFAAAA